MRPSVVSSTRNLLRNFYQTTEGWRSKAKAYLKNAGCDPLYYFVVNFSGETRESKRHYPFKRERFPPHGAFATTVDVGSIADAHQRTSDQFVKLVIRDPGPHNPLVAEDIVLSPRSTGHSS